LSGGSLSNIDKLKIDIESKIIIKKIKTSFKETVLHEPDESKKDVERDILHKYIIPYYL
jgi:hypothetical protein